MDMFCYQCQETAGGNGCTKKGVCLWVTMAIPGGNRMKNLKNSMVLC